MNRIDRLTGTILLLQSHRCVTASQIAAHWEISERTVYRDIAALGEAGVPIVGEAGTGYRLMAGYNVPPIMFTSDEAAALFVGAEAADQVADESLKRSLRSALLRIRAVLPQDRQNDLSRLKEVVGVWLGASVASASGKLLMPVQEAILGRRCIELQYDTPARSGRTSRVVEPLGLMFYSGHWHLIGFCRLREDFRDFRVDRIEKLELLDESFDGRADFSVRVSPENGSVPEGLLSVIVVVDAPVAERFRAELFRGLVREETLENGQARMEIATHSLKWFAEWLLRFGVAVHVEAPDGLRRLLREVAMEVVAQNSGEIFKKAYPPDIGLSVGCGRLFENRAKRCMTDHQSQRGNMKTETRLTAEAFRAARRFIETAARPLEIARFHFEFEGGSRTAVIDALRMYQNTDGGFGRALEPDFRAEQSSALCTVTAFDILRSIRANSDEPMVSAAIAYFLKTFDQEKTHWRLIPETGQDAPRAPWWNNSDTFDKFSLNPTAAILGYLYDHQEIVPEQFLSTVSDRVVDHLKALEGIGMHDLLCCITLLKAEALPATVHEKIYPQITRLMDEAIAYDPKDWKGYVLRPVQVVDTPESFFLAGRERAVGASLDYEISEQRENGFWVPTWTWGGAFPAAWEEAHREWSGIITLARLSLLKQFHRIDLPQANRSPGPIQ